MVIGKGFPGVSVRKKVGIQLGGKGKKRSQQLGGKKPQAVKPKSASGPQLNRQDALKPQRAGQTPVASKTPPKEFTNDFWDNFGRKAPAQIPGATTKPQAAASKPQISAEDRALLDKMDPKQDVSKLGKAKDDITVGTKASALANTAPDSVEPKKGGFFSNSLVQTIGGTLVGTLGLNALTSMFSGGGGSAEAAPAPAPAPAANSYDPYAAGSYGVPGSIPNYF